MKILKQTKIKAHFTWFRLRDPKDWNSKEEHKQEIREIEIQYRLLDDGRHTIKFEGAVTGYEEYPLSAFTNQETGIHTITEENLCICSETPNSWPRCTVKTKEVQEFVKNL